MTERRIPLFLVALGLLHIGLSLWFASITPYRTAGTLGHMPIPDVGAPDERQHANYIQGLLSGEGFPVLDIGRMQTDPDYRRERYENHQPPLYYIAAAAWCKVTGIGDVSDPLSVGLTAGYRAGRSTPSSAPPPSSASFALPTGASNGPISDVPLRSFLPCSP